jgi:hemolysin activation/secretion protein
MMAVAASCVHAGEFPSAPLQLAPSPTLLSTTAPVFVREFQFEGNTIFSSIELAKVVASYTGRELGFDDLEDARRAVTLYYAQHGYINSGAVFSDQHVADGVVVMRIIEGRLTDVRLSGNRWLRSGFIKERVERWAGPPLNMNEMRDGLQLLRQNPNIAQINAELRPGATAGESYLDLHVRDTNPFRLGLQVDNSRPPSVGSEEILLRASDCNLTGNGDSLQVAYGIAEGGETSWEFSDLKNADGSYTIPLTRFDTTLQIYGSKHDYAVIEQPFNALDITSESYDAGVSLRQPFYETANREFALAVAFDRRQSKTFLLGVPFDVTPGSTNGVTDISALRISQEWIDRTQNQLLALRSTFSVGIDAFGVTDNGTDRNAKFWAWLGQAQYARRLFNTANTLILRATGQYTDRPLLSLEQFPIGGPDSVRGYRENQLVRDQGVFASAEFRIPIFYNRLGAPAVQLAPFFDFGGGWNVDSSTPEPRTISSAGIGLLLTPNHHLSAQLYWGYPFRDLHQPDKDPQDLGLNFLINFEAF